MTDFADPKSPAQTDLIDNLRSTLQAVVTATESLLDNIHLPSDAATQFRNALAKSSEIDFSETKQLHLNCAPIVMSIQTGIAFARRDYPQNTKPGADPLAEIELAIQNFRSSVTNLLVESQASKVLPESNIEGVLQELLHDVRTDPDEPNHITVTMLSRQEWLERREVLDVVFDYLDKQKFALGSVEFSPGELKPERIGDTLEKCCRSWAVLSVLKNSKCDDPRLLDAINAWDELSQEVIGNAELYVSFKADALMKTVNSVDVDGILPKLKELRKDNTTILNALVHIESLSQMTGHQHVDLDPVKEVVKLSAQIIHRAESGLEQAPPKFSSKYLTPPELIGLLMLLDENQRDSELVIKFKPSADDWRGTIRSIMEIDPYK